MAAAVSMAAFGQVAAQQSGGSVPAAITAEATDVAGLPIEIDFRLLDRSWTPIVGYDTPKAVALVPPGSYVVEPTFDPLLAREVTVTSGKTTIRFNATDRLVLHLRGPDQKQAIVPLLLKKSAGLRRSLAAYRPTFPLRDVIALPRTPLGPGSDDVALMARKAFPATRDKIHANAKKFFKAFFSAVEADKEQIPVLALDMQNLQVAFRAAARILSITGKAEDAAMIAGHAPKAKALADALRSPKLLLRRDATNAALWEQSIALAAYIENRLGLLGDGAVRKLARSHEREVAAAAATYLHYYGVRAEDSILQDYLRSPSDSDLAFHAAEVLLDRADPATLETMRSVVSGFAEFVKARARDKKITTELYRAWEPAAMYLLVHGGKKDWKLVAGLAPRMSEFFALKLATLSRDPRPLIDHFLSFVIRPDADLTWLLMPQYVKWLSAFCPVLRGYAPADAAAYRKFVDREWGDIGVTLNISGRGEGSDRLSARTLLQLNESYCRSSPLAAEAIWKQQADFFDKIDWLPQPGFGSLFEKSFYIDPDKEPQLDQVPRAILSAGLATKKKPYIGEAKTLFLAYHRLASFASLLMRDAYPYGSQRRFFAFLSRERGGAFTGILAVRPEATGTRLRLGLAFDLASFGGGTMISGPDAVFGDTTHGAGATMVEDIRLMRNGRDIPLTREPGPGIAYDARLESPGLSNLYLYVTLTFLDRKRTLVYDLFASDYAAHQGEVTAP